MSGKGKKRKSKSSKSSNKPKKSKSVTGLLSDTSEEVSTSESSSTSEESLGNVNPEVPIDEASPSNRTLAVKMDQAQLLQFFKENFGEILSGEGAQDAIEKATRRTLKGIEDRTIKVEKTQAVIKKIVKELKNSNDTLTAKVDNLEQEKRNKTLKIMGMEENKEEDLTVKPETES